MRDLVIRSIEQHKLIAILRGIPADRLIPTAEALYRGGIRLLEGFCYARTHGLNDALFKVRILKNRMHCTPAETYGFFMGAVLCDEIGCILAQNPAQIVLAGKRQLREPMQVLLNSCSDAAVVSISDDIAGCASALGAVRIFEYCP